MNKTRKIKPDSNIDSKGPIIDGDARPDQLSDERIKKNLNDSKKGDGEKFTSSREADVNSLENFKDEK